MSESRPLRITLPIIVKTYDIDFAHIVHNAVYIRWLEDLRQQMMDEHYPMAQALADGRTPILTHTDIHYKWPTRFGDQVVGQMWISRLSHTKWEVQAEILANGLVAATAAQNGYFADLATLRPTRIPELLRQKWLSARE
ncbi:MAG: acyl-CoA thioesterase [Anaerolineae bacterium]|nr:acyl-CoA thioesterase [Anaerolineae bacterium]